MKTVDLGSVGFRPRVPTLGAILAVFPLLAGVVTTLLAASAGRLRHILEVLVTRVLI